MEWEAAAMEVVGAMAAAVDTEAAVMEVVVGMAAAVDTDNRLLSMLFQLLSLIKAAVEVEKVDTAEVQEALTVDHQATEVAVTVLEDMAVVTSEAVVEAITSEAVQHTVEVLVIVLAAVEQDTVVAQEEEHHRLPTFKLCQFML